MDYGKYIPKTNNEYSITKDSYVYSHKCGRIKQLKPVKNGKYLGVNIHSGKIMHPMHIHVIMAIVYLGHIPNGNNIVVDHIDRNKYNNKLNNLRLTSQRLNKINSYSNDSAKGVDIKNGKYRAQIKIKGIKIHLGYYNDKTIASEAYITAKKISVENNILSAVKIKKIILETIKRGISNNKIN